MPVSRESASSSGSRSAWRCERILVISPSWLGDCIMLMPAILELRRQAGQLKVAVLAKPAVAPLWRLCPAVDEVLTLGRGNRGMMKAAKEIKAGHFDFSYVVPNSFRSALIPFLARIPGRRGFKGHFRRYLLTEIVRTKPAQRHQSHEAFALLGLDPGAWRGGVLLRADEQGCAAMKVRLGLTEGESKPLVGMFPGAARGPSKRWPEGRFAEVGRRLVERGCRVILMGSDADRQVCERIAGQIGAGAVTMAGETALPELMALLSLCRVVIANDSGGMHLTAAVGTTVVALYGVTDPGVTGPIGEGHVVLMAPDVERGRDVARRSTAGKAALELIPVDAVCEAVVRVLNGN